MARRVERTRNGGTWTESQYWGAVRSALRDKFKWWKPMKQAKLGARRKYEGEGRNRWEYQCAACKQWFKDKETQIDHVVPCGSLRCPEDIAPFLEHMTCEDVNGYQVMCKPCHQLKTNEERKSKDE